MLVRPTSPPIGLNLARAARLITRAFEDALGEADGSVSVWLVLLNLKIRPSANQRELAEAVGIREATLTHHLNAMENAGLLTRRRDQTNRRIHIIELTEAGESAFLRLRDAAVAFDQRLRRGISSEQLGSLDDLLNRLTANVAATQDGSPPWADLVETPS